MVVNVGRGNPGLVEFVLESRLRPVEVHRQMQRQDKSQQRDDQREHPNVAITPRQQQQQQRARQRDERHQRENDRTPVCPGAHRVPIQIM